MYLLEYFITFKFLSTRQWKWKGNSIIVYTSSSLREIYYFMKLLSLMLPFSDLLIGTYSMLNLLKDTIKDSRCDCDLPWWKKLWDTDDQC